MMVLNKRCIRRQIQYMLFCDVKEEEFELNREFQKNGIVYKEVRLRNRGCICKGCGTFHTGIKEYREKKIVHSIYACEPCTVIYHQRRFLCPVCGKTCMEENPFRSEKNRVSDKTVLNILEDLKRYSNPFSSVAERYGISTRGVIKIFDRYVRMERLPLTKVMCFDEIYFSRKRRKKYVLVVINYFNRAIIDVLKDRDKITIARWLRNIPLEERNRVEYISIDMNESYKDVLSLYLHNATVIVDSFHVMKRVSKALNDIRTKVMRRYEKDKQSDEYYLLKYRDQLLYKKELSHIRKHNHHYHFPLSENELKEKIKQIDEDLSLAYELYHMYASFNEKEFDDPSLAEKELNEIILSYRLSGLKEFKDLADTLEHWKKEIVNSFSLVRKKRINNGPIEGRNSLIKKVLRIANGYSNFERFRNRIIYSLNRYASHSFKKDQ